MDIRRFAPLVLAVALASCSSQAPSTSAPGTPGTQAPQAPKAPADRKYLLDRVDDAAIVQLYADGFTSLPLKQKTLIWHLYQAALAGRDIFIDQKHKDALEMREVIEQIIAYPQGVDAATLSAIQRYAKLFWLNNGPYNNLTARKFVLTCTPEQLKAAVDASAKAGAKYMTWEKTIDQKLERLAPMFFDPNVDPIVTNKTPGAGKDILQASANNLYSGVSMADLKGFNEKYGLNSRLVKQKGKLVEEVYRIDGGVEEHRAEPRKFLIDRLVAGRILRAGLGRRLDGGLQLIGRDLQHELPRREVVVRAVVEPEQLRVALDVGEHGGVDPLRMRDDLLDDLAHFKRVLVLLVDEDVAAGQGRHIQVVDQGLLLQRQRREAVGVELHDRGVVHALEQVFAIGRCGRCAVCGGCGGCHRS